MKTYIVFASLILCAFTSVSFAIAPSFQGLGNLPGGGGSPYSHSSASSISDDGKVVIGSAYSGSGQIFRWTEEDGMQSLGNLPDSSFGGWATAISKDCSVIAGITYGHQYSKAYQWTSSLGITELSYTVEVNNNTFDFTTFANDVSADGSFIVGKVNIRSSPFVGVTKYDQACYWVNNEAYILPEIDQTGHTVGTEARAVSSDGRTIMVNAYESYYENSNYVSSSPTYLWSAESDYTLLPSELRGASFMSDNAKIIAGSNRDYAFVWSQQSGFSQIDNPEGWDENHLQSLNADGSIAGGAMYAYEYWTGYDAQFIEAYIWDAENGLRFVEDILSGLGVDLDGWQLSGVTGISGDGMTICGWGENPNGVEEAWVAIIPEPATLLLFSLGGLMLRRRR